VDYLGVRPDKMNEMNTKVTDDPKALDVEGLSGRVIRDGPSILDDTDQDLIYANG
jgi:hypothetical protein